MDNNIVDAIETANANQGNESGLPSPTTSLISAIYSSSSDNEQPLPSVHQPAPLPRKRSLQQVSTLRARIAVVKWMVKEVERCGTDKFISSKAVRKHPQQFRGNEKANLGKASRWYKDRDSILARDDDEVRRVSHLVKRKRLERGNASAARKEILVKAGKGRSRKLAAWTATLHGELIVESERLSKTGLKFNAGIITSLAKRILANRDGRYTLQLNVSENECLALGLKITKRWTQSFMERYKIVARKQCGKLMISPVRQEQMEQEVGYHLGVVSRQFSSGNLDEDMVENVDETHFIVNTDDGRNLSFVGCNEVKYADVSSGGEGMTMMVRITGGENAVIEPPFIVFQNKSRNYPIRGVPDDVPGVSYRTGPKGWMDQRVFSEWLSEPRAIKKDVYGRKRVIFLDNCSGHGTNENQSIQLRKINAELRFLPKKCHASLSTC